MASSDYSFGLKTMSMFREFETPLSESTTFINIRNDVFTIFISFYLM